MNKLRKNELVKKKELKGINKSEEDILAKLLVNRQPIDSQPAKKSTVIKQKTGRQKPDKRQSLVKPLKTEKPKSKAQLKREAKEQADTFMGCFWIVLIILFILVLIWLF